MALNLKILFAFVGFLLGLVIIYSPILNPFEIKDSRIAQVEILTPNSFDETHVWIIDVPQSKSEKFYNEDIWEIEPYLTQTFFKISKSELKNSKIFITYIGYDIRN